MNINNVHITNKESQILNMLACNLSVLEIADKLYRSPKTIYKHIENVKKKLQCDSFKSLRDALAPTTRSVGATC